MRNKIIRWSQNSLFYLYPKDQTRDLLAQCEEDDISLHGVMMAASLAATARVCCQETCTNNQTMLRASIVMNLRQFISRSPKHGNLSAPYEVELIQDTFSSPHFYTFRRNQSIKLGGTNNSTPFNLNLNLLEVFL